MAANEGATMSSLSSEQSSSRKRKRERTAGDLHHHQPELEENNNNSSKSPSINALGTITTEAGTTTDKPTNEGETSSTVVDPNSTNKLMEDASTAMGEKSESQVPDSHKLHVWGLSPEVDEAAVRQFFQHYGSIVDVQFYKQVSRYCYVSFTTKEAAFQACKEKHLKMLAGQSVLCKTCEKKEVADHIAVEQVIINNNFSQVEDRLQEKYRNCGKFFVFLPPNLIDHDTNVGWAFIKFDTEENMSKALKLDASLRVPGCPNVPTYKRSRATGRHSYSFKDYRHRREPTDTRFDSDGDDNDGCDEDDGGNEAMIEA